MCYRHTGESNPEGVIDCSLIISDENGKVKWKWTEDILKFFTIPRLISGL